MGTKLYVGNLSFNTTETDLQDIFARAGPVQEVTLMQDKFTGKSRGFAFVTMTTEADAQKAITEFNGKTVEGRPLTVNEARPREAASARWRRRRRGGGYGGGWRRWWRRRSVVVAVATAVDVAMAADAGIDKPTINFMKKRLIENQALFLFRSRIGSVKNFPRSTTDGSVTFEVIETK